MITKSMWKVILLSIGLVAMTMMHTSENGKQGTVPDISYVFGHHKK